MRIELTTSALPRMRSTTELRQHACVGEAAPRADASGLVKREGVAVARAVMGEKEEREARLAERLRANLRRRKEPPPPPPDEPPTR